MARLKEKYLSIKDELKKELGLSNIMQVPYLEKIVLNIGVGSGISDKNAIEAAQRDLSLITGQHPVITEAKRAISAFKLRAGMKIGVKVTLRGDKMYEFLDRLITIAIPRIRDFQGVSKTAFDKNGNYNLGIKEHIIFPEIDFDSVYKIFGMNITFAINCQKKEHAKVLLEKLGMPFKK